MEERDEAVRLMLLKKQMPKVARGLKLSRQAPYNWKQVPALQVLKVAKILRMKPYELRPDIYPKPGRKARKSRNGKRP